VSLGAANEFVVTIPFGDEVLYIQLQPRTADGQWGPIRRVPIYGSGESDGGEYVVGTITWQIELSEAGDTGLLTITLDDPLGVIADVAFERTWWEGAERKSDRQHAQPAGSAISGVLWGQNTKKATVHVPIRHEKHASTIAPVITLSSLGSDGQPLVIRPGVETFDAGDVANILIASQTGWRAAHGEQGSPPVARYDNVGDSDCLSLWRRQVATGVDGDVPVDDAPEQIAPTASNPSGHRVTRLPFAAPAGQVDVWHLWGRNRRGEDGPVWPISVADVATLPPWQDPNYHPPPAPPEGVTITTVQDGDCAAGTSLRHSITWDGDGVLYWWDGTDWRRPAGMGASASDPKPVVLDALGGGYVLDPAGGVDTEIKYRVARLGVGGTKKSTDASVVQKVRRCGPPPAEATLAMAGTVREPHPCALVDIVSWTVQGWDASTMRLEYRMLNELGTPIGDWRATPTQAAAGELIADVHAGRQSFKVTPDQPDEYEVRYGVELQLVRTAGGAPIASAAHSVRYVVGPCSRGGTGGGGGGGGGRGDDLLQPVV
jgi:hypothetical protein